MTIYLLYEDTSKEIEDGWIALAKKIVKYLRPDCQTHLIRFSPVSSSDVKWAAKPSCWCSSNPRDRQKIVAFHRFLANTLLEENSFLFFHFDADCPHQDFANPDNNYQKSYLNQLYPKVKEWLVHRFQEQSPHGTLSEAEMEDVERRMTKWMALVPCYSLESWLYRNFRCVIEIFNDHHHEHPDRLKFERWQQNPEELDEIVQIKEETVLRDRWNGKLATESFPAKRVYQESPSFRESVERARGCALFLDALDGSVPS